MPRKLIPKKTIFIGISLQKKLSPKVSRDQITEKASFPSFYFSFSIFSSFSHLLSTNDALQ
jgi:hypothetical protein